MKVRDWLYALQNLSDEDKERELAVWMPGSVIEVTPMEGGALCFPPEHPKYGKYALIEGNMTEGSVLSVVPKEGSMLK